MKEIENKNDLLGFCLEVTVIAWLSRWIKEKTSVFYFSILNDINNFHAK